MIGKTSEAAGVIAVTSFSGAPGVTTMALCLAAAWPRSRPVTVVEADPRGSALALRFGLHDTRSVSTLLVDERHALSTQAIAHHATMLPPELMGRDVSCLIGGRPYQRGPDLRRLWHGFCDAADGSQDYIIDIGRFEPDAPTQAILERAEQVFVLVRGDLESIGVAKRSFPRFALARGALGGDGSAPRRAFFVCTGGPYAIADLAKVLESAQAEQASVRLRFGELDRDEYAAAVLCGDDRYKVRVPRSRLVSTARNLLPSQADHTGRIAG